jgi:hypothetical protein
MPARPGDIRPYLIRSHPQSIPVNARNDIAYEFWLEVKLLEFKLSVMKVERK